MIMMKKKIIQNIINVEIFERVLDKKEKNNNNNKLFVFYSNK